MIHNATLVAEIPSTAIGGGALCSGCGCSPRQRTDGTHEKIVATGWFIDYEGQVVLCETCITFLGGLVGLLDPAKQKVTVTDVRRQERRDVRTRDAFHGLLAAKDAAQEVVNTVQALAEELDLAV